MSIRSYLSRFLPRDPGLKGLTLLLMSEKITRDHLKKGDFDHISRDDIEAITRYALIYLQEYLLNRGRKCHDH